MVWRLAEADTLDDAWTSPRSDKLYHNVEMPGNAPGLNPLGKPPDAPFKNPCYCDVGLTCPHEWSGICENGKRPTMEREAAQTLNWVLLDGQVAFGRNWWTIARQLAEEAGYSDVEASYIENTITRNSLPLDVDCAVGLVRNGKPRIYASTVDRNWVMDRVLEAVESQGLKDDEF